MYEFTAVSIYRLNNNSRHIYAELKWAWTHIYV